MLPFDKRLSQPPTGPSRPELQAHRQVNLIVGLEVVQHLLSWHLTRLPFPMRASHGFGNVDSKVLDLEGVAGERWAMEAVEVMVLVDRRLVNQADLYGAGC